jgi:hypothetical protein
MRKKAMITAAGVLAAVRIGGAALAGGGDREGTQVDPKADRAVAAALEENRRRHRKRGGARRRERCNLGSRCHQRGRHDRRRAAG